MPSLSKSPSDIMPGKFHLKTPLIFGGDYHFRRRFKVTERASFVIGRDHETTLPSSNRFLLIAPGISAGEVRDKLVFLGFAGSLEIPYLQAGF